MNFSRLGPIIFLQKAIHINVRMVHVYRGVTSYNFLNNYCISFSKIEFVLANSAHPVEMPHNAAFHLVCTVCQSTRFGVSGIQRVE